MSEPERETAAERPGRKSFLRELKDREVFQTAGAYAVVAWGVTEIIDGVVSRLGWPEWLATAVVVFFVVGFPVALFLAWIFDWTPDGIRRDEPWRAKNWASLIAAGVFLLAGSAALFWLINPSQIVRIEQVGVAVMPCRYRGDEALRFRGEGMAELIQAQLTHSPSLRVPAFRSIVQLADRNLPTAEFAQMASVEWIVDCRLSQTGQRWTLDVALVEAASDTTEPLYSVETADPELADAADQSARAIRSRIAPGRSTDMGPSTPVQYPDHGKTLDAYLLGEQAMRGSSADDYRQARQHFREAQGMPGFTLARVREADALMAELQESGPGSGQAVASLRAIGLMLDAAQAKDPSLAELFAARMRLDLLGTRLNVAESPDIGRQREWLKQAIALRPSYADPHWLLADALRLAGADDEAEEVEETARALDPLH